ncbi:MAG: Lrp/AsnC family transcriptional regulator, partial [Syntrophomonadaceae bacterium]|nr:Lrp/AsnC family transcriptional regulator [Syntrophomonadaceae bacterium]
ELRDEGKIRRLSAVLHHREAGYRANAMVVWQAEPEMWDRCGEILAGHKAVSHCYLRAMTEEFPWPLYTMVHARDEQELTDIIAELSRLSGLENYNVIRSVREFKKSSMRFDQG